VVACRERIPEISNGIQEWYELDIKAWDNIKKILKKRHEL